MSVQTPTPQQAQAAWDAIASRFDEFVTPANFRLGEQALRHIDLREGTRVLDVAAGSGALSILAARSRAHVVAIDIAPNMIERLRARARAEGLMHLEARVMDGQDLQFPDNSFDASVSQHGVSLFPDMQRGLTEMVRVTRPGGSVVVVAFGPMQQAEFIGFFSAALRAAIPGHPGIPVDPPPLPFQVADPDVFLRRLTDAGLANVHVDSIAAPTPFESATHMWNVVTASNPIAAQVVAPLMEAQRAAVVRVLDGMLRERSGGEPAATLTAAVNIGLGTA